MLPCADALSLLIIEWKRELSRASQQQIGIGVMYEVRRRRSRMEKINASSHALASLGAFDACFHAPCTHCHVLSPPRLPDNSITPGLQSSSVQQSLRTNRPAPAESQPELHHCNLTQCPLRGEQSMQRTDQPCAQSGRMLNPGIPPWGRRSSTRCGMSTVQDGHEWPRFYLPP